MFRSTAKETPVLDGLAAEAQGEAGFLRACWCCIRTQPCTQVLHSNPSACDPPAQSCVVGHLPLQPPKQPPQTTLQLAKTLGATTPGEPAS